MNCPSCNAQLPPDATACPGCGAPVAPAASQAAPAAAPAAPQDAPKKPGFDIKACSSNPIIKQYGAFIACGIVVLLVLIICLASCSGGNADMEYVIGSSLLGNSNFTSKKSCDEKLEKKALDYLKKAAKHGSADAMYTLGKYHEYKEENTEAKKYFEKASKKGYKLAEKALDALDSKKKSKKSRDDDDE